MAVATNNGIYNMTKSQIANAGTHVPTSGQTPQAGNSIGSGAPSYLRYDGNGGVVDSRPVYNNAPDTPKTEPVNNVSGSGGGSGGGSGKKYVNALFELAQKQFDAQEKANKLALDNKNKLYNDNLKRQVNMLNNQHSRTAQMIERQLGTGTNGNMLTQQVNNNLARGNNVHDAFQTRNSNVAQANSDYYNQYANLINTFANNLNNTASLAGNLGGSDALEEILKKATEMYGTL